MKCYPCEVGNHDDCRGPDCDCTKTEIETERSSDIADPTDPPEKG